MKPITPCEAAKRKKANIPEVVIEVINEFIAKKYSRGYVAIEQGAIVKALVEKGLNRSEIFEKGWLDIKDIYGEAGWKVEYDKPGYNESYEATFKFTPKNN